MSEYSAYTEESKEQYLQNVRRKWTELCNVDGLDGDVGFYDTFFHIESRKTAGF